MVSWSRIQSLSRRTTWACILIIIILSLLPGSERPHTGFAGKWEHVMAYFGAGVIATIGYHLRYQRLIFGALVAILSFILEFLQQFVPDRGPTPLDAIASSSGLILGLLVGSIGLRMFLVTAISNPANN